jgi:HlyD family secretion protein
MLAQARAERDRAAAALEQARDTSKRREQLNEAGLLSREELESSRTAVVTAASTLRAAEAAVAQAAHQVDVARARLQSPARSGGRAIDVRSPVPGVVLKRMHESEAVVAAGEPLIEIGDPSRIEIVSDLLSTDAVRVKPGSAARIEDWGGGTPLEARVRLVEPSGFMKVSALGVEEQRVNVILDLVDAAAARALGDGYRVEVRIVMWESDDVLTVPTGSLFRRGDQWAVFVVAGNRAELRSVELGHRNSDAGEIVKGLEPGDQVVLHPPDTLEDGARVRRRES